MPGLRQPSSPPATPTNSPRFSNAPILDDGVFTVHIAPSIALGVLGEKLPYHVLDGEPLP